MAALTMSPATIRQPFAPLDAPRMRSILRSNMNVLNKQNGMGNMLPGKKQPLAEFDSENTDPTTPKPTLKSTKRKRAADDEDDLVPTKSPMKPTKSSSLSFAIFEDSIAPTTPKKTTQSTPKSAPLKPAGRSPQLKATKPFSRRATISKSRPESARKGIGRPFSLATALSTGKSKPKSQPAPASKMPASWSFEIYVDSEQEEMTNLMQHSTCVLDISDDEGKDESQSDHRGKENIPPADLGTSLPRSRQEYPAAAAHKSDMVDEPRSPLGELNAADFYGEGCHAFSYAVVYDEEEEVPVEKKNATRSRLSSMSSIESVLEASPVKAVEEAIGNSA
ncbi:hypothetical protein BDW72DRAFT_120894 [Aspergillus terricola var. indicus]